MEFKEILIIMYSKLKDKNAIRDPFFLYSLMSDYCNKDFLTKDLCHKYLELNKKIDFVNIILDNGSKKSLDILHDKYRELKEFISLEDYKIFGYNITAKDRTKFYEMFGRWADLDLAHITSIKYNGKECLA